MPGDTRLVEQGLALLDQSAAGTVVSAFHIEAAIAAVHATARSVGETDWAAIVGLYDRLMAMAPSPVVALNRAIASASATDRRTVSRRLRRFPMPSGWTDIRSIQPQSEKWNFAAENDVERRFLERRLQESVEVSSRSR